MNEYPLEDNPDDERWISAYCELDCHKECADSDLTGDCMCSCHKDEER